MRGLYIACHIKGQRRRDHTFKVYGAKRLPTQKKDLNKYSRGGYFKKKIDHLHTKTVFDCFCNYCF